MSVPSGSNFRGSRAMLLHRVHLNPRSREARRDLADPYEMHSTLARAFSTPDAKCAAGEFLWRVEPEAGVGNLPRLLVQSRSNPDWTRINPPDWLAQAEPGVDLRDRLELSSLRVGQRFRFRLRANPCVTRNHKRLGLLQIVDQESWLARKGELHGFRVPRLEMSSVSQSPAVRIDVLVSQALMLRGKQRSGNGIRVFSVLFDGYLSITDPGNFALAVQSGIGHGKALGLGLLSIAPVE